MKLHFGIKNLRSLKDTSKVSLKPINILVGRNSAGKSTFARVFPLLKQSIETRSSAPILWWGDDVDFGDFKTSVHNRDVEKEISFHFVIEYEGEFSQLRRALMSSEDYPSNASRNLLQDISKQTFSLDLYVGSANEKTVRRRTVIDVADRGKLVIDFDATGTMSRDVTIDGLKVSELIDGFTIFCSEANIFSRPAPMRRMKDDGRVIRRFLNIQHTIITAISDIMKPLVDARTSTDTINAHAFELLSLPGLKSDDLVNLSEQTNKVTFKKLFRKFSMNRTDSSFRKIEALTRLFFTLTSLQIATESLRETFLATSYLKPVRVRGERFTRAQELEVSEVSPDGSNLPVFLASLNKSQIESFSSWVQSLFGYGIDIVTGGGQISIVLVQGTFSVNVADTGYGISQILPVLAKTWWSTQLTRRSRAGNLRSHTPQPIVMEQPELHLHPAHQARLADVFVDAISRADKETKPVFLIETHSETLINRLGEIIEARPELADKIQILVFSDQSDSSFSSWLDTSDSISQGNPTIAIQTGIGQATKETRLEIATFDTEGVLKNWPYGFFGYKQ